MDLNVIARMKEAAGDDPGAGPLRRADGACTALLRKIERAGMDPKTLKGGKPVACGLAGPVGRHRHRDRASPATAASWPTPPRAEIGLPEILVGIFPGAGGTTRLVRMMGVMAAAPLLLEGKMLEPEGREGRRA